MFLLLPIIKTAFISFNPVTNQTTHPVSRVYKNIFFLYIWHHFMAFIHHYTFLHVVQWEPASLWINLYIFSLHLSCPAALITIYHCCNTFSFQLHSVKSTIKNKIRFHTRNFEYLITGTFEQGCQSSFYDFN